MGLTKMPLRTFYLASQVGMLPGTMVYVNAGRELAGIESSRTSLHPRWYSPLCCSVFFRLIRKVLAALTESAIREVRMAPLILTSAFSEPVGRAHCCFRRGQIRRKVLLVETGKNGRRLPPLWLRAEQNPDPYRKSAS